jgi:FkbM family methyltransferase
MAVNMNAIEKILSRRERIPYYLLYHVFIQPAKIYNNIKYRLAKKESVKINGLTIYLNPQDEGLSKDLAINPDRESEAQSMLEEIKPNHTVIDIGANIGYYVLKESTFIGENGSIHAIEPVESNYNWLSKNIEKNNRKSVHKYRLAIGEKDGEAEIYIHAKQNMSGLVKQEDGRYKYVEKVKVKTLTNFVKEQKIKPDFVRMDVEGYEYHIIKGGLEALKKHKPKLMMEIHPSLLGERKTLELLGMLKEIGYECTKIAIENPLYPLISKENPIYGFLLFLFRKFNKENYLMSKLGGAYTGIKIEDLIRNKGFLMGVVPMFHVLLEAK